MRTIGITGGIASGKSAVCDLLSGYSQIDADLVSREVVAPGTPGLAKIANVFGKRMLLPDGGLDRAKLRNTIAKEEDAQQTLNQILHPLILASIREKLNRLETAGTPVALVSAALMIETGSYRNYDKVVLVTAPYTLRLRRLLERDGMDEATARQLMDKQWPDERKRTFADGEIVNDGDMDRLKERTEAAMAQLGFGFPGP